MGKLYVLERFAVVPNSILYDSTISLSAKGLFAYLQAKPDGWRFSISRMSQELKEGRTAIRKAIQELEEAGYLIRKPVRGEDGKFCGYDYVLTDKPVQNRTEITENLAETPSSENPTSENPTSDSLNTNINTDIQKQINKNRDINGINKDALNWLKIFVKKYKQKWGVDYIVDWGKETKMMTKAVRFLNGDRELFERLVDDYLDKDGKFYRDIGWSVKGFIVSMQGLLLGLEAERNKQRLAELLGKVKKGV